MTGIVPSRPESDPVAMTRALVRTPSVNPDLEEGGAGEAGVAALTASWLRAWGYRTEVTEVASGRCNVVASRGRRRGGPSLLLCGHLDTVGVAEMTDPFSGRIRDGRLRGRGAADMKSGVACALAVAAELAECALPGQLTVALTCDEEHAALGMAALVEGGLRADAAVVCEPTALMVMPAHKGFLWVNATVRGRAAHGSRPELGIDAIARMGHLLVALEAEGRRLAKASGHRLLGPASIHAGTIRGGSAPSVYPDRCTLVLERRTLPGETQAGVMGEIEAVAEDARMQSPRLEVELEAGLYRAASEVPVGSELVQGLVAACGRSGQPGAVGGMSAWVEASFLNESGTPAVCFGPGSIAQAHTADEWVQVDEIEVAARVLTDFAATFLECSPPRRG